MVGWQLLLLSKTDIFYVHCLFSSYYPLTYVFKFALLQLDEISSRNNLRQSWEGGEQSMSYGPQNAQSQRFFQPLDCNPTLQIG